MRVLITGATGFLGKKVLERVIADPRVSEIHLVSRTKNAHPDDKVKVYPMDLSDPSSVSDLGPLLKSIDSVIHLAGLYHFESNYSENYQNNVLPTLHLIRACNQSQVAPPIYFSSTFAVGLGSQDLLSESPLKTLSHRKHAYAHTKGIAEKLLEESSLPTYIFRVGAIVGSTTDGFIEKADGPYLLLKTLRQISRLPGSQYLFRIPIPADPEGMIPVIPIETASRIFHEALFNEALRALPKATLSAFDDRSAQLREICDASVKKYFPRAKATYIRAIPKVLQGLKRFFSAEVSEMFEYSLNPIAVQSTEFRRLFPNIQVPPFQSYRHQFFSGFEHYCEGRMQ